jgi:uncharacterized protein YxeA
MPASKTHQIIIKKVLPMSVEYEKMSARNILNDIRTAMHMNTLLSNTSLAKAAQAHADYIVTNDEASHYEVEGHLLFTGIKPVDRAMATPYVSRHVSENLSTASYSAEQSIDGLFSAIYHRFGFLSPSIDQVGVGVTQKADNSEKTAFVYLMGNSDIESLCHEKSFTGSGKYYYKICKTHNHRISARAFEQAQNNNKANNPEIILYPYNGQTEVPPAFYAEEPDPLPDYDVSGFPISIVFNDYYLNDITLDSFKLYTENGDEITELRRMDKSNDPHQRFTDKQFALFPLKRLVYDNEYTVKVNYHIAGKQKQITWHFHTKIPKEQYFTIKENHETIQLSSSRSYILYFEPQNAHDLLKNIQFPADVSIEFLDNNTLKLSFIDKDIGDFTLRSGHWDIHIKVD